VNDATTAALPVAPLASPARLALRVLSDEDVRRVHAAALRLLGDQAAAEAAAAAAPARLVLGGRVPERDVTLDGTRCVLGTGGPAPRISPRGGRDPRGATSADLTEAVRLADALSEVAVVCGPPLRAAGETALGELALCLAATSKHVQLATLRTAEDAEAAVRMARAVAASDGDLRARPLLSLCGGPEVSAAAEVFACAGLPVGFVAALPGGDTVGGPASAPARLAPLFAAVPAPGAPDRTAAPDPALALVRHHAGVLAACAAVQAAAPGAPFLYLAQPALAGLPACGPQAVLFQVACVQLARLCGLPLVAAGMGTGSHGSDWQASTQNALGALGATAAGADLTTGAGTLGGGGALSLQQLVMDGEAFSWNARIAAGIAVDEETIALEDIEQVGIGGNYLSRRHTRRHMKDVWRPRLLDRSMWDAWVAAGREDAAGKADALVESLLAAHEVLPLGDGVLETVRSIAAEA
jgi:trimethylamine---corrinoid protein Co-methyltransferase